MTVIRLASIKASASKQPTDDIIKQSNTAGEPTDPTKRRRLSRMEREIGFSLSLGMGELLLISGKISTIAAHFQRTSTIQA
jgi:hypothetical protein